MASSVKRKRVGNEVARLELAAGAPGVGSDEGTKKACPKQLMGIPTDVHVELFRHLSPTSSACLGLTCKTLYAIHWSRHGKVPLEGCDPQCSVLNTDTMLCGLLRNFMAPLVLEWCRGAAKFVPVEKLGVREANASWKEVDLRIQALRVRMAQMETETDLMYRIVREIGMQRWVAQFRH